MSSFNLVHEPWIPCLYPDGKMVEENLYDALAKAHLIQEIWDSSPLVLVSLHRLLLAILHRNFGPADISAWKNLWQQGRFEATKLANYFDRWQGRFDLFHPERPFYQVPNMPGSKNHPVHILAMERAAPNNATLWDHSFTDNPQAFSPAWAARYLVATQAYAIGIGKSDPFNFTDSPMIRGYSVLNLGNNLWQTLCLNLMIYNEQSPIPWSESEDLPAWEQENFPSPARKGNTIRGYLDYLTWQSRRIHLIPQGDPPVVRWCQRQQNLVFPKSFPDPFKAWKLSNSTDSEKKWSPRNLIPEKAVWRDSQALFQSAAESRRPEIFEIPRRLLDLQKAGEIKVQEIYNFLVVGLCFEINKSAKVLFWRKERLPLPLAYLEDKELFECLTSALNMASNVGWGLRSHCKYLARLLTSDKPEEIDGKMNLWAPERRYYSQLEAPFWRLLLAIQDDDLQEDDEGNLEYGLRQLPEWGRLLQRTALKSFRDITAGLGSSPRSLKAVARVEDRFRYTLYNDMLYAKPKQKGGEKVEPESAKSKQ